MRIVLILLLTLLSGETFSQIQQFTLDNGLKVLVKEDHRAPIVVSMVWYNVGSADEPGGLTGISHVLEHMMFKGTLRYPLGAFSKIIAALGGQENAFTNNDYTAFFEKIAANHIDTSFKLEADRMQNLSFDTSEFAKEIQVIQEERRLRTDNNPQALTYERFLATAHLSSPYHHPVIGWMSDLKQMQITDAETWYRRFYAPNHATLVVVGDVEADNVHRLAKKYFGKLKKRPSIARKRQLEPRPLGNKKVIVNAPAQIPMLMIGLTAPTVNTISQEHIQEPYALEIIASILAAGDSGRLTTHLIQKTHLANSVEVFYNIYARYQTQFVIYGSPSQSVTLDALKKGILDELQRLQQSPISDKELQRVKTQIIAQKTFERDSIFSQAMELGMLETIGLGWQTADHYIDRINQVNVETVQKTAKQYFKQQNITEARLIPTDHQIR